MNFIIRNKETILGKEFIETYDAMIRSVEGFDYWGRVVPSVSDVTWDSDETTGASDLGKGAPDNGLFSRVQDRVRTRHDLDRRTRGGADLSNSSELARRFGESGGLRGDGLEKLLALRDALPRVPEFLFFYSLNSR